MNATLAEHHLQDERQLAQALALDIAQRLATAVAERGSALLAVSGGKSPVALFQSLATQPLLAEAWPHITVLLVDERCVPPTHADSNARLVHEHLLQGPAAAARWVPLVNGELGQLTATQASVDVQRLRLATEARLAPLPWPLDVAVLGMGLDAHTASFFPGAPGLGEALTTQAHCAWVLPDPVLNKAHHARITLSLSTLLAARHLCLPLSGAAKQAVYAQARQAATHELPVSLLLCQTHTPVAVWLSP
jgi:6-phosphogluconolactonase